MLLDLAVLLYAHGRCELSEQVVHKQELLIFEVPRIVK